MKRFGFFFFLAGALSGLGTVGTAAEWAFDDGAAPIGRAVLSVGEERRLSFSCRQVAETDSFSLHIVLPDLIAATGAGRGESALLDLEVDGAAIGRGGFLNTGKEGLAVSLPRDHALLTTLRGGVELGLSAADPTGAQPAHSVKVPLVNLDEALATLATFCDRSPVPDAPGLVADCTATEQPSDVQICNDPVLAGLEADLAAMVIERRDALKGDQLAAFMQAQKTWLGQRAYCGTSTGCLSRATSARIEALKNPTSTEPAAAAATASPVPAQTAGAAPAATAQPTAIAPLRAAPVPLTPSQLQAVLTNPASVEQRFVIEAVRARPALLDQEGLLSNWYRRVIAPTQKSGGSPTPQQLAIARDHLQRSVAAIPPGPFLIATENTGLYGNNVAPKDNGLVPSGGTNSDQATTGLGRVAFRGPLGFGQVNVQARSRFDAGFLPTGAANAHAFVDAFRKGELALNVVIEINEVDLNGSGYGHGSLNLIAGGEVRYVGVYREPPRLQQNNSYNNALTRPGPTLNPGNVVHAFPIVPPTPIEPGLHAVADRLNVPLHDGKIMEGFANSSQRGPATTLLRIMGVRQQPPTQPSDALRAFVYGQLATPVERDDAIPPHLQPDSRYAQLTFDHSVDEFERGEIFARIDKELWPRMIALVPQPPLEGISAAFATLGEYDSARGGFPLNASTGSMGLAVAGDFPALGSLPDFLPAPIDQARQLLQFLESTGGAGSRRVMFVAQYRIDEVYPVEWDSGEMPRFDVELLALSLHARGRFEEGDDPFAHKIADLDVASYRGPARPVASPERVAFWEEVDGWTAATTDEIAFAALGVTEDPEMATRIAAQSRPVRQAEALQKEAATRRLVTELLGKASAEPFYMKGQVTVSREHVPGQPEIPIQNIQFVQDYGPLELQQMQITFVDPTILHTLSTDAETAGKMFDATGSHYNDHVLPFSALLKPVLAVQEGRRDVLYVEPVRIVVRSAQTDGTGYPPAHIEITPEPAVAGRSQPVDTDPAELVAPEAVPLDAEYLDLLMVQRQGDDITDATYRRMMRDRRLREIVLATLGQAPPWGRFFRNPEAELNAVQYRAELDRFKEWTRARAELLPDTAYVQAQSFGMMPSGMNCVRVATLPQSGFENSLPADMAARLEEIGYERHVAGLNDFQRNQRGAAHESPPQYFGIYGRPSLPTGQGQRKDSAQYACAGNYRSPRNDQPDLNGAAYWNALVIVDGGFRMPVQQGNTVLLRDVGSVSVDEVSGTGLLEITLDVARTEVIAVGGLSRGQVPTYSVAATITPESLDDMLPAAPDVTDTVGMSPGQDWEEARALAGERLTDAMVASKDGPPLNFRMETNNTLLGPQPVFIAYRNGDLFVDTALGEAVALMREPERDPDRVLAVGSYRTFAPGTVDQEALIGALLRKYGEAPETEDDRSRYGSKPGKILAWGGRAGCLPDFRSQVDSQNLPRDDPQAHTAAHQFLRNFAAPNVNYHGGNSMTFERCKPVVWASVGEDNEGRMHLTVWSLDLALLHEVGQMPDPTVKVDGSDGSRDLMKKAAEIDL